MKATIEKKTIENILKVYDGFLKELTMNFKETGLLMKSMDPANVAMIIATIPKSNFSNYELKKSKDLKEGEEQLNKVSISVPDLLKVFKRFGSGDISLDDSTGKLLISSGTKKFKLPIIELDSEDKKIPDLTLKSSTIITSKKFKEIVEDASIVSESLHFKYEGGKLIVEASGDLSKYSDFITEQKGVENHESKFSVEYLKKAINLTKLASEVNINLGEEYPILLKVEDENGIKAKLIIAPRVSNE